MKQLNKEMQRDILFLGKREDNGEWIESKGLMIHSDGTVIMILSENETGFTTTPVIPETVGQLHNGLTLKAKKNIFVGDILMCDLDVMPGCEEFQSPIKNNRFTVESVEHLYLFHTKVRLIGNIHDNGTAK